MGGSWTLSLVPVPVGSWDVDAGAPPPGVCPGLGGRGSPRGARTRFSEGVYAIVAAQLGAGLSPRVNGGGPAAWAYSNAADVASSCGTWTEEKGEYAGARSGWRGVRAGRLDRAAAVWQIPWSVSTSQHVESNLPLWVPVLHPASSALGPVHNTLQISSCPAFSHGTCSFLEQHPLYHCTPQPYTWQIFCPPQ